MSVSAALILVAATAWLATPPGSEAGAAEPSAALETPGAIECVGIALRSEQLVPRPEAGYVVLAADNARAAAGSALLAYSDTAEGLAQAVRDAAREDPSVAAEAARNATTAAASDDTDGAFMLRALYTPDTDAAYGLVTAPCSAVWTSRVDGYEYLGTAAEDLTVDEAWELIGAEPSGTEDAAGKLVLSGEWHFVTVLDAQHAPAVGERVRLEFGGFSVRAVTAYAGGPGRGERAVIFVSNELPPDAVKLRRSAARVIIGD